MIRTFILTILFFLPIATFAAEEIKVFDSVIRVETDSSFSVTETITYDFGSAQKHGIFRFIPTTHPQESSGPLKKRYTDITLNEVQMDGADVLFLQEEREDELYVRIGDPNTTITGQHVYTIEYTVRGGLLFLEGGKSELYWNVTGTEWNVPMRRVTATIKGPSGLLGTTNACYVGVVGGVEPCGSKAEVLGSFVFRQVDIAPGGGLTVGQVINRDKLSQEVILEETITWYFWAIGIALWFVALITFVYRYKTAHRTGRPIIAQYEPYKDFKPMYTGLLFDGTLNPQDITACIVYLAQQGYIKIRKTEKKALFFFEVDDYAIDLRKAPDEALSSFQKEILTLLFDDTPTVGQTTALSKLKTNTSKQKENHQILQTLKSELEKDLREKGFFQVTIPTKYVIAGIGVLFFASFMAFDLVIALLDVYVIVIVVVCIASISILAFMYRRRTRMGYEALDYLKGFKLFLATTEKERYAFHNAPTKSPEQFMEYLPYAIAFGVEKEWSEVFKDITIPNPDWYDGGTTATSFSAVNLTTSLGAFSSSFATSTGSSGSSGGGSVGGGGGGGGGGSW